MERDRVKAAKKAARLEAKAERKNARNEADAAGGNNETVDNEPDKPQTSDID